MPCRPGLGDLVGRGLHFVDDVDDVGAELLDDAERDRRLAVDVGVAGRILERAGDLRHVAEGDDGIARGLDRQRVDVGRAW